MSSIYDALVTYKRTQFAMVLPLPENAPLTSVTHDLIRDKLIHEAANEGAAHLDTFRSQVLRPGEYNPFDYGVSESDSALLVFTIDVDSFPP